MIACGRYVEPAFPSSRRYDSRASRHALPMVDYTSVKARTRFHTVCVNYARAVRMVLRSP
jgi:hypothetical protein